MMQQNTREANKSFFTSGFSLVYVWLSTSLSGLYVTSRVSPGQGSAATA